MRPVAGGEDAAGEAQQIGGGRIGTDEGARDERRAPKFCSFPVLPSDRVLVY